MRSKKYNRKNIFWIILILFFSLPIIYLSAKETPPASDIVKGSIKVDKVKRDYIVYLPEGYISQDKLPLLIILHGRFGTGKQMMETSGFNEIADREKFIAVYPDGYRKSWADGRGKSPADKNGIDDVKFISELIDKLADKYNVDTSEIFVTGHSNGGFMTQVLGVKLSDRLAGITSVSASVSENLSRDFSPSKNIPVMFINATEDSFVPYEGGKIRGGGELSMPVEKAVAKWLEYNGCANNPSIKEVDEVDDGTSAVIYSYTDCKTSPVKLIKIIDGGHSWPGGESQLPQFILGRYIEGVNASEEVWKFFKDNME